MLLLYKRLLKPLPIGLLHLVFLILLIWQLGAPSPAQSQGAPDAKVNPAPKEGASAAGIPPDLSKKNVLVLHSFEANAPVFEGTDRGLSRTLQAGGISSLNQFFESLELRRNPGSEYRKLLVEQMRMQYSHRKLDLIITMYPEALEFVLKDCRDILPHVSILALYLPQGIELPKTGRRIIGHFPTPDIAGTLEIALKLVPGAKRVYVVSGAHEVDKRVEDQARRISKKWEGRLEFLYLSHMPFEDMLATISSTPPGSIILALAFSQDVSGKSQTSPEVAQRLSQVSRAPIFGILDVTLGHGITGGSLINFEHIGTKAGELVLDILGGAKTLDNIPAVLDVPPVPMFDWRELRRWKLSEAALPKGSIVINREVTFWDFRYYIVGGLALCLLQSLLIVGLLLHRRHRRSAEESLRKAEEKYRNIFEGAVEGIFETSPQSQLLTANPALARTLGHNSPGELISSIKNAAHLYVDPDKRAELVASLEKQDVVLGFECEFSRRDGTKIWVSINSRRVCDPDGKTLFYSGFLEDITERKRAEEALRESEKEAQRIAREALAMAEIGRIVSSTLTIEEVYEPFVAEVKKIIPFDRIVINMIDQGTRTVRNVYIAGGEIQDREVEKVYPLEGSGNAEMLRTKLAFLLQAEDFKDYKDRFPMLLSTFQAGFRSILNVPLFSRGNIIGGLLLRSYKPYAYEDEDVRLTERIGNQIAGAIANAQLFLKEKQTEEALRASEERFRQVAENVGDFIWEVDAQGLYRYTSPSVERILGYTPDELVGKMHFYDLFAPEVREELKAAAFTVFAAKQSFRAFPNPNLSKEGRVVHLETSGAPVLDANGNLAGYRGADTDVTERKKAEEELRKNQEHLEELVEELRKFQEHLEDLVRERTAKLVKAMAQAEAANRAKSAFLANMSHELRAPLNSILGIAQLMERDEEFPEKQRELLEILSRSGQQLFELIDDVLEMSRIEAGQTAIVSKTFDLHRFLDDLEEMMIPRAEKKGLPLIFERDSALPQYIQTDGRKLRQILINLLGNAIKFTEKGRVTLRTNFKEGRDKVPENESASPVRLEFEVEDTGIGFAREDREKIFDPFVQLNPAQKPSGGIGLGLAICHKFAALLGGEITVRSQVGRGTTFKLDIGVQPSERSDTPAQEVRGKVMGLASGQPGYRLLIVDDNLESRLLLRRLLEPVGFRVLEAAGGPEAIDLYRKDQPDLIWMDIRMSGMDGYEATRRIREAERERRKEDGQEIHTPIIALTAGVMENTGSSSLSEVFDDWVYKPFRETEVFDKLEKHLGVQFVSRPPVSSAVKADNRRDKAALSPADLSVLSADWLKDFFQTMEKGRTAQLLNLIDQIRPEHADLARALAEMVRIHQYEKLIPLTREALKEDVNG